MSSCGVQKPGHCSFYDMVFHDFTVCSQGELWPFKIVFAFFKVLFIAANVGSKKAFVPTRLLYFAITLG